MLFEIVVSGRPPFVMPSLARYLAIRRGVLFSDELLTEQRKELATQKALEATGAHGCPCRLLSFGEAFGDSLRLRTKLTFVWQHVLTGAQ